MRSRLGIVGLLAVVCVGLVMGLYYNSGGGRNMNHVPSAPSVPSGDARVTTHVPAVNRVLVLGASVAEGWDDWKGGGYLARTFRNLSAANVVTYEVYNKAASGDGVLQVVKSFPGWLSSIKPNVVVLSWGTLDDLNRNIPMATVRNQVKWEILQALRAHAVVLLVTPPVTRASYVGKYAKLEPIYVSNEIIAARSLKNPNVYVFDVFNQMKTYIASHHQTVMPYVGDGWHPNAAGHILAAGILIGDIKSKFGTRDIQWR